MALRTLIVDDEHLARERIRSLLAEEDDFEIVSECASGTEAVDAIRELGPDLVFLDVQMPGLDGLAVVDQIGVEQMPLTVFVTAFDQHALKAFDAHAIDYLLKPFDRDRFERTLKRVRQLAQPRERPTLARKLDQLLASLGAHSEYLDRLVIRSGQRLILVDVDDVELITSEGNYLRIHTKKRSHLLRETMTNMELRLDPAEFVRIHRGTIVRTRNIMELESVFQGEYVVVLRDGTRLASSRGYRENLERAVKIS
jgi:two-component system LytT family response regulator